MAERIWDNNHVIGEVPVSEKTKIVVCASIRDGVKYINLRQWYQKKDLTWNPSLDGMCIAVNPYRKDGSVMANPMPWLSDLLQRAEDELNTMPLFDEANVVYRKEKTK